MRKTLRPWRKILYIFVADKVGDIGVAKSGWGDDHHSPVFGIVVGMSDHYKPSKVKIDSDTGELRKKLKLACKEHDIKYRKPSYHLCSYTS